MADHIRTQLRDAVKTAVTSLTTTGARVFDFRVNPLQPAELPGLCVYTLSEEAQNITLDGALYQRTIELHVVGYAAANSDLDDTLDTISKEVETALAPALTVGSKAVFVIYSGCSKDFAPGEKQAGSIDLAFSAQLFNVASTPDVLS